MYLCMHAYILGTSLLIINSLARPLLSLSPGFNFWPKLCSTVKKRLLTQWAPAIRLPNWKWNHKHLETPITSNQPKIGYCCISEPLSDPKLCGRWPRESGYFSAGHDQYFPWLICIRPLSEKEFRFSWLQTQGKNEFILNPYSLWRKCVLVSLCQPLVKNNVGVTTLLFTGIGDQLANMYAFKFKISLKVISLANTWSTAILCQIFVYINVRKMSAET